MADVTTEWLTAEDAGDTPGAAALRATALDGTTGTTDRRRLAVEWNESGTTAGLPANLFIKNTPLTAKNRSMVAALGMAINEARFYNQVATELPAVAPRAWYARARYLEGLKAGGATDGPGPDVAFERYRLFAAEAWDATAMTINWPGLQAQQNADAPFRRTCTAVEDLETAAPINRLYR